MTEKRMTPLRRGRCDKMDALIRMVHTNPRFSFSQASAELKKALAKPQEANKGPR